MWQLFLEYREENFNYREQDSSPEDISFTSIKEFSPRCLYRNPIENVDVKVINTDFDPNSEDFVHLHCLIASFIKTETIEEEEDMLWCIPYISRTRREALSIKQAIESEEIKDINGMEFPWNKEGYELEDIEIVFLPIED